MATTTPNFGWVVPTSTDLVKDGATAIETLGDSIDASLLDLKGGTSGQVLKKNSNTDMDFIWAADSAGMTNPMTTTGDTIYSSSGSTPARLGIGTTGQILTVSGGLPVWSSPAGGGKVLQVIQGTSTTATSITSTSYTDTTLTASITPSSASSKVLVILSQMWSLGTAANAAVMGNGLQLVRGATSIADYGPNGYDTRWLDIAGLGTGKSFVMRAYSAHTYLDSPSTTSATTYKTQGKLYDAAYSMQFQNGNAPSTIILMEIGA